MSKTAKLCAYIIFAILVFTVLMAALLHHLLDPNRFKDEIGKQFYQLTGRELSIQGKIELSYFPWVGFKVNQLNISNDNGFKTGTFASVKSMNLKIRLIPLWRHQVIVNRIILNEPKLHFIVNEQGKNNWSSWQRKMIEHHNGMKAQAALPASQQQSQPTSSKKNKTLLQIHAFQINNGVVIVENKQNKTKREFRKVKIRVNDLKQQKPFDFALSFNEVNPEGNVISNFNLSGSAMFDRRSQHLTVKIPQLKYGKLKLENVDARFNYGNNILRMPSLTAELYQGQLKASAVADFSQSVPRYKLNESVTHVAIGPLLALTGLQLGRLENGFNTLRLVGSLWQPLTSKIKGFADLKAALKMQGKTVKQLRQSLSGKASFVINQGQMKGLDLSYLAQLGIALIKRQQAPQLQGPAITNFSLITGDFDIQQGIASTDNLQLQSDVMQAQGHGDLNLNNEKLNFRIVVTPSRVKHVNHQRLIKQQAYTIPLRVSGTLSKPAIQPDLNALLKQQVGQEIKKFEEKSGDQIDDKIHKELNRLKKRLRF